ncbi:MAG: CPBP family intramembrane glutamic endopeptidase, partial [bacterium]
MELTFKKSYARVGMGLFLFVVITVVAQIVAGVIVRDAGLEFEAGSPLIWVLNFAPMYCIALPISLGYLGSLPAPEGEGEAMTAGRFAKLLLICFPIMYIGNIIGTGLSALLSGDTAENPLVALTTDMGLLGALVVVVIGPLVEELFFRKAILSRVSVYGEKTAILYAALAFALFHMNLFQFFYAFGLGLVFGYVYVRTRKLR